MNHSVGAIVLRPLRFGSSVIPGPWMKRCNALQITLIVVKERWSRKGTLWQVLIDRHFVIGRLKQMICRILVYEKTRKIEMGIQFDHLMGCKGTPFRADHVEECWSVKSYAS
jgi:hypothetical protein